jgi:excinuclease ABC subunit C
MTESLQQSLNQLPHTPGVYQYYDANGQLLYVGKAKDLAKRVQSYFTKPTFSPWTKLLLSEVTSVKVVEVSSELEAVLLENSFIKSLKPKYNIKLKDDKTYPFLRVSKEDFPVFTISRRAGHDKARYYGPYFSATYLHTMLKLLQELYGIKIANDASYENRSSVPKQIGLGARSLDNKEAYQANVIKAVKFITSPQSQIERLVKQAMVEASESERYEQAGILRDRLMSLFQLRESQSLFSPTGENRDYIGFAQSGKLLSIYILFERDGSIVNHKQLMFETPAELGISELYEFILTYLYVNNWVAPQEIVVEAQPADIEETTKLVREQSGRKVAIVVPQRGELKKRLETAIDNASYQLQLERLKTKRTRQGLLDLKQLLNLAQLPKRIEAFDISNLGATAIVGATIVFIDGKPDKNEYRKYNIIVPKGQDDFASMRELVFRRVSNAKRAVPDLLLIDGGKGQLSAALDALKLAQKSIPIISLAKKQELIFVPNQSDPIALAHDSDALLLLTAIRDEVHRYVIGFHRFKRNRKTLPRQKN